MKFSCKVIQILLAVLLVGSITTIANGKSVRIRVLDSDLTKLPFGQGLNDALKWVKWKIDTAYGPKLKRAVDHNDRRRLTEEMNADNASVKKSLVRFDGKKTGLEIGIVGSEFVHNAGESLIKYKDNNITHFLFFSRGKLWKYARAQKSKNSFSNRLKRMTRDLGLPSRMIKKKGVTTEAVWKGDRVVMSIKNMRKIFGTDLLVVVDRKQGPIVAKQRKSSGKTSKPQVDPELKDIVD